MPNVWVVRADGGEETQNCVDGGFTGIGWQELGDLSDIKDREGVDRRYRQVNPDRERGPGSGQDVGVISRFLHEIDQDDWVVTPEPVSRWLRVGQVSGSYYYAEPDPDGCRYAHRRAASWERTRIDRWSLSGRLQDSLKSALTVYAPSNGSDLFEAIARPDLAPQPPEHDIPAVDPVDAVLSRLRGMKPHDFEKLVEHLLAAMGFEETKTTKPSSDGGFDVYGVLNVSNVIRVEVYGQVKRFRASNNVGGRAVRDLRGAIPYGAQGAFFTTSDYSTTARAAADDPGFPPIGLTSGRQLVELLIRHWNAIPPDFRDSVGLRLGLVSA